MESSVIVRLLKLPPTPTSTKFMQVRFNKVDTREPRWHPRVTEIIAKLHPMPQKKDSSVEKKVDVTDNLGYSDEAVSTTVNKTANTTANTTADNEKESSDTANAPLTTKVVFIDVFETHDSDEED